MDMHYARSSAPLCSLVFRSNVMPGKRHYVQNRTEREERMTRWNRISKQVVISNTYQFFFVRFNLSQRNQIDWNLQENSISNFLIIAFEISVYNKI
jgi:hypothetical protein